MKNRIHLILMLFYLLGCNNKAKKENLSNDKRKNLDGFFVVGIGKIIPEGDIIQLSSPTSGIVKIIYKKENDSVNKGTVILELEHQLEDEKIILLEKEIKTQSAQIKVNIASLLEFQAKSSNSKLEFDRLQNLFQKGAETQQKVDDALTNLKTLNANLKMMEANVSVSKGKLQEIKVNLKTAEIELGQKIIKSPIKGKILELNVLLGEAVSIEQSFIQISPLGKTIAICEIDELNADKILIGQEGWIRSFGAKDTLTKGKVYFASSFLKKKSLFTDQSGEKEDRRVRTIKLILDHQNNLLFNSRIECVIDVQNKSKK
jgi:HlyD family secretion protein